MATPTHLLTVNKLYDLTSKSPVFNNALIHFCNEFDHNRPNIAILR